MRLFDLSRGCDITYHVALIKTVLGESKAEAETLPSWPMGYFKQKSAFCLVVAKYHGDSQAKVENYSVDQ